MGKSSKLASGNKRRRVQTDEDDEDIRQDVSMVSESDSIDNDDLEDDVSDNDDLEDEDDEEEDHESDEEEDEDEESSSDSEVQVKKDSFKFPYEGKSGASSQKNANESLDQMNPIQIQVTSIIRSIKYPSPTSSISKPITTFIDHCVNLLLKEKSCKDVSIADASSHVNSKFSIPFPDPKPDPNNTNWKVGFEKPTKHFITGAWASGIQNREKGKPCSVELALEMPEKLFQENDIKSFRYFHKRAFYLSKLASALAKEPVDLTYSSFRGDERLPVLLVKSKENICKFPVTLIINPCISISSLPFPLTRLSPTRSNIKTHDDSVSTSSYNNSILSSASRNTEHEVLQHAINIAPFFTDAALLLRNWVTKRGPYFWPNVQDWIVLYLAHLLSPNNHPTKSMNIKGLPKGASALALARGTLDHLARHNWKRPTFMASLQKHSSIPFGPDAFANSESAVFVDPSGAFNLLEDVPITSLEALSYQASVSLTGLHESANVREVSTALNPTRTDPYLWFDNFFRLEATWKDYVKHSSKKSIEPLTIAQSKRQLYNTYLSRDLKKALSDRVKAIYISVNAPSEVPVNQKIQQNKSSLPSSNQFSISIGLSLEPFQSARIVDHGPTADDKEACQEFRTFWGKKSELRRFKDGSIQESVVWQANAPSERATITSQILTYILHHRFAISSENIQSYVTPFDQYIEVPPRSRKAFYTQDPKTQGFGNVLLNFENFVKECKSLEGLPLGINHIAPISESLRYTSPFVPGPRKTVMFCSSVPESAWYIAVQDAIVEFESSHQWPEDLEAVQKLKAAFLARLGELYSKSINGSQVRLYFDKDALPFEDNVALEILTPAGYAFRLWVHHPQEHDLLAIKAQERQDLIHATQKAMLTYERRFLALPKHHEAIKTVQHMFPSYSPALRMLKRFLSTHGISPRLHFPSEAIELIVASVYLPTSGPDSAYPTPANGATGFLRSLQRLAEFYWREEYISIPLYSSISNSEPLRLDSDSEKQFQKSFDRRRRVDPGINRGAWVIFTEEDEYGTMWTTEQPSKLVAQRVKDLAKAALKTIATNQDLDVTNLFTPSFNAYEFVAHLNPEKSSRTFERTSKIKPSKSSHLKNKDISNVPLGFDPATRYVVDMQKALGDSTVLFYDEFGGDYVGGIFNPLLTSRSREFNPELGFNAAPVATGNKTQDQDNADDDDNDNMDLDINGDLDSDKKSKGVILNKDAIVWELEQLSDGLINRVEKNWS